MTDQPNQPDQPNTPPAYGTPPAPGYGMPPSAPGYGTPPASPSPASPPPGAPVYGAAPGYGAAPPPAPGSGALPLSPAEERQWGMLAHVLTLGVAVITSGTLGFVAALAVYLMYKDRSAFVRLHAANALNVQIVTIVGVLVSFVLMFVLIGFVTLPAFLIYALIVHIMGAVKANNGESWTPPLTPRIVS